MAFAVAGSPGNFEWADRRLHHDAHHSVHGNAWLTGYKEGLSSFIGRDQRDAVTQEWRQLGQSANVPGLEQVVLIRDQLILAEGGELEPASQGKWWNAGVLIAKRRAPGDRQVGGGFRGKRKKKVGPKFCQREGFLSTGI